MTEKLSGASVLRDRYINRGTAFSDADRDRLKIRGLVPPVVKTIEQQAQRVMERIRSQENPLEKYVTLDTLRTRNQTLFFHVLANNIRELMPIVYTPTVGKACMEFDHLLLDASGLYVSIDDLGRVDELVANVPLDEVDVIVVTDGERVLGLGDLGARGMGIPKGKLALYTVCGGIPPSRTLPVMIDVGTNNAALTQDPLYQGLPHVRIDGDSYYKLLEEFITAARKRWPNVLIQFEDFANHHAFELLDTWKNQVTCFNDDIEGTAAVTLAGFYSAVRAKGSKLSDEKILFFGAGEAAIGVANLLVAAMEEEGLSREEASNRIYMFDSKGLVNAHREDISDGKKSFAHDEETGGDTLLEAIELVRPTAIVGSAAQAGAFNAYVLGTMSRFSERPIIFALSNPTSKAECTARDAYVYTAATCLFASGSPFGPVDIDGKTYIPRQANNFYIFPGVGLGAVVSRAKTLPQGVFLAAARALAACVTDEELEQGSLYPPVDKVADVSLVVAEAVAEYCYQNGLAGNERPEDLVGALNSYRYVPEYPCEAQEEPQA